MSDVVLRFKIEAYSPETFPMERLGEYLVALGSMLGNRNAVHFVGLRKGSTSIVHRIDAPQASEVLAHVDDVRSGAADIVSLEAYRTLNRKLKEDRASGKLVVKGQARPLITFAGIAAPDPQLTAPIVQPGTIDGMLISVGGRDATVPARIEDADGTIYRCTTTRDMARQLAPHLFGRPLRLIGEGRWLRSEDGMWSLENFKVLSFEPLDETPLTQVVAQLRSIEHDYSEDGSAWQELLHERDE